jgi:hypothetical protein
MNVLQGIKVPLAIVAIFCLRWAGVKKNNLMREKAAECLTTHGEYGNNGSRAG